MNINDFNSDRFGEDSDTSSSLKNSSSQERVKNKNNGDINDVSDSDDENVSEDDEGFDSHNSGTKIQSPWRQDFHQMPRGKELDSFDEF